MLSDCNPQATLHDIRLICDIEAIKQDRRLLSNLVNAADLLKERNSHKVQRLCQCAPPVLQAYQYWSPYDQCSETIAVERIK